MTVSPTARLDVRTDISHHHSAHHAGQNHEHEVVVDLSEIENLGDHVVCEPIWAPCNLSCCPLPRRCPAVAAAGGAPLPFHSAARRLLTVPLNRCGTAADHFEVQVFGVPTFRYSDRYSNRELQTPSPPRSPS